MVVDGWELVAVTLAYLPHGFVLGKPCSFLFVDIVMNNLDTTVAANTVRWCSHCLVCVGFVQVHVLNWPVVHLAVACLINHASYANEKHWEKSGKSEHSNAQNIIEKTTQKQSEAPESGTSKPKGWLQIEAEVPEPGGPGGHQAPSWT